MKLDRVVRICIKALLIASLYLCLAPSSGLAQQVPMTDEQAIDLLVHYGIVRGDGSGDLLLQQGLTRAEAATLFIRAVGMESNIRDFLDVTLFADMEGHWANGYVNMASRAGLMKGYDDETFRPDQPITYGEMLTVILRVINQEPTEGTWPDNVMSTALDLGIAPPAFDIIDLAYTPAQRGRIFPPLGRALRMPVGNVTALQRYMDDKSPTLTISSFPTTTPDPTVTVSGRVNESAAVTINDRPVDTDSNGEFRAPVTLTEGVNRLIIRATDMAGNETVFTDTITRQVDAARFDVTGPTKLAPGQSAPYTIRLFDSQGRQLPDDLLRVEVQGNIASWNQSSKTLTAGNRTGTGVLILRAGDSIETFEFQVVGQAAEARTVRVSSLSGSAVPPGRSIRMVAQILDADGFVLGNDSGRPITVTLNGADDSTLVWERDNTTVNGAVYFSFMAPSGSNSVTVTASADGLTSQSTTVSIGTILRVSLNANPRTILANGTSTALITASLRDQDGKTASNTTGGDISILLKTEGVTGNLDGTYLTIPAGASVSDSVTFTAGTEEGGLHIAGSVISSPTLPVDSTSLVVMKEGSTPPTSSSDPVRLELASTTTTLTPGPSHTLTVRVLDSLGRLVTKGNYAFQITVTTSNNEEIEGGLPEGVTVKLGNTNYSPVDDGYPVTDPRHDTTNVVGRTANGVASIRLTYGRSGLVNVNVTPVGYTADAVQDNGTSGPAISSIGLSGGTVALTYTGTPAKIRLTADSAAFGKDQTIAAMPAQNGKTVTLRAELLDATDALIPNSSGDLTLVRASGDNVTSAEIKAGRFIKGVATFQVTGSTSPGEDLWQVQGLSLTSDPVRIITRTARPDPPDIRSISGYDDGIIGEPYLVAPDDTHMMIELFPQNVQKYVVAKVYRANSSTPIFISDPFDISTGTPVILVPKEKLSNGQTTYQVSLDNGAGESAKSASSYTVANVRHEDNIAISGASYNATTRKLVIQGSGLSSTSSGGVVDPTKLIIEKGAQSVNLGDGIVTLASNSITIDLSGVPEAYTALEDTTIFNGSVNLRAEAGWYRRTSSGLVARPDTTGNPVTPMANITSARLDLPNKRLYLYGIGFTGLSFDATKISVRDETGNTTVTLRSGDSIRADGDRQLTVTLSNATTNELSALDGANNSLLTEEGWSKDSRGGRGAALSQDPTVYNAAIITRATYDPSRNLLTLRGSGFTSGTLDITKLSFKSGGSTHALTASDGEPTITATMITIKLTEGEADEIIEAAYAGSSVTLEVAEGWLTDEHDRPSAPVPPGTLFPNR